MKQGWEIKKIKEIIVENKKSTLQSKGNFEGKFPFFISGKTIKTIDTSIIDGDNIYLPTGGKFFIHYYRGKASYSTDTWSLRTNSSTLIKYLFYFLLLNEELIGEKYFKGATIKHLQKNIFKEIDIPIPSILEQQRIVSILDECFAAIAKAKANAEQNLKNAKELFESYLQEVFDKKGEGWEKQKLSDIAFVKSGGTPSRSKKEYWEGNIAWYSSGELNDIYTKNPERFINELAIENSNAKLFPKGSLLIGMYDTAALKMSIIDRDATFNQAIAGVKPNSKIDLLFIFCAINAQKPELLNLRRGTRQKNLSLEKIKDIQIPLPPIKEQQAIVRQLDALRAETQKLEAVYHKKLEDLEELKKSVLQKAFNGEL